VGAGRRTVCSSSSYARRRASITSGPCDATARAGNRRFDPLSALRAHPKAPYETDLRWETLRALKRAGRARTESRRRHAEDEDRAEQVVWAMAAHAWAQVLKQFVHRPVYSI
jgi:hypothetical protein